jgi:hypothetical protein
MLTSMSAGGWMKPKANVETVGEHQRVARLEVRRDVLFIDLRLDRVGQRHHDHVGFGAGLGIAQHAQPVAFRLGPALAARVETDAHIHAALLEVERMGMALAAVAEDRDLFALQIAQVCLVFVVDFRHDDSCLFC